MHLPHVLLYHLCLSLPHCTNRNYLKKIEKTKKNKKTKKNNVSRTSLISGLVAKSLVFLVFWVFLVFSSSGAIGLIWINPDYSKLHHPRHLHQCHNIHAMLPHLQHLRLISHSLAFLCICTPSPCRMLSNRLATQQIVFNALLWTNPWAVSLSQSLTFQSYH